MKSKIALFALLAAFATGSVVAAENPKKEASPAQKAQQEKMKSCNAEAKKMEYKGDERKKFMSGCLSAKADAKAPAVAEAAKPAKPAKPAK